MVAAGIPENLLEGAAVRYSGPRKSWLCVVAGLGLMLAVGSPADAQDRLGVSGGRKTAEDLVGVRLIADVKSIGPGQTFHLAVIFDIEPQWHIYWRNPGQGAPPPNIRIEAPDGFEVGEVLWPRPMEEDSPIGLTYVYKKQAALFVPIIAPDNLTEGSATIRADIRWAVCKELCLLGRGGASIDVKTTESTTQTAPNPDPLLTKLKARLPKSLTTTDGGSVAFGGSTLTLTGPAMGLETLTFFPGESPGVSYSEPKITIEEDRFHVKVDVQINHRNTLGKPVVLRGLIALGWESDEPSYEFALELPGGAHAHD